MQKYTDKQMKKYNERQKNAMETKKMKKYKQVNGGGETVRKENRQEIRPR